MAASTAANDEFFDTASYPAQPIKPFAALLAAVRLFRNPQDTDQVGILDIALAGNSQKPVIDRFIRSETGQAVIRERHRLEKLLDDHDYLGALPALS